ncbi:MAG: GntR family transcriptional regulator [Spirochaetales bacterium]|nr:GntR family transcriptional regulator [Spirochaetales bacterium]
MRAKDTANHVYASLRKEILGLDIVPGQLMREQDICERFEASRTPVHVALERLCDTGLLEFVPYKGVRATLLKFSHIYQIILMRTVLETKVLIDFARKADPFALERCHHSLRNQGILLASDQFEPAAFYALDSQLHQTWFDEVGFPLFWDAIQDSEVYYTRFRMLDIVEMHNFKEIVQEHAVLLSLLESQQYDHIEGVLTYHLFGGIRRMQHVLQTDLGSYFSDAQNIGSYLDRVLSFERPDCLSE